MVDPDECDFPNVPGFTLTTRLGSGGMGAVYLAENTSTGERVAIKLIDVPASGPGRAELLCRFEREARLMAQLRHAHIVRLLGQGLAGGRPYLIMEYLPGGSLRSRMQPGTTIRPVEVRPIITDVVAALTTLADAGIVHRDLKPENLLLDKQGRVKVSDFGIAAREAEIGVLTRSSQVMGSFDYMAPEQRARLPIDGRADQFSLAVIVYEMLTGKRPVGMFKQPSELNRKVHPSVNTVLARALQEDPDDRYPDLRSFARELDQALGRSLHPRVDRRWLAVGSILLAACVVLAIAGMDEPMETIPHPPPAVVTPTGVALASGPTERREESTYFLERGDQHLKTGHYREAESCFTEAIRLSPKSARPYLRRALLYKKTELYQKALDDLSKALELDETLVDAWIGQGSVYVQLEDYQRAIAPLDRALAIDAKASDALAWRGRAYYKMNQPERALQDLNAAIATDPLCGVAYQFRALVRLAKNDYPAAKSDLEDAVRCLPGDPHAHSKLADLLALCPDAKLRDPARGVTHARIACELTQWHGWNELRYLAKASAAAGDIPAAVHWAEEALRLAPEVNRKAIQSQLDSYRKRLPPARELPR